MKQISGLLLIALALALGGCLEYQSNYQGIKKGEGNLNPEVGEPGTPGTPGGPDGTGNPGTPGEPVIGEPNPMEGEPTVPTFVEKPIKSYDDIGPRVVSKVVDGVIITEGVIRPRRRHENDMDFAKYNPFYWEGRESYFKVEDYTKKGQKKIKFTLRTEAVQNYTENRGPDFSAIYTGDPVAASETTRSKFALNKRMNSLNMQNKDFDAEITEGDFNAYAEDLKIGKLLMFEFRFFMDESTEQWRKQKARNPHNLSAYYSEFFRIKLGEGGLFIDDVSDSKIIPPPQKFSGGWATTPLIKVEPWRALQQQGTNLLAENSQPFLNGRTWFHTDMVDGHHQSDEADDKPALFYEEEEKKRAGYAGSSHHVRTCNACHFNNGQSRLPPTGQPVIHSIAKTSNKSDGSDHKSFGLQLQPAGANGEGTLKVARIEKSEVKLADGTVVVLKKPIFEVQSGLDKSDLGLSIRRPLALQGVGLLNAISDETIQSFVGRNGGAVSRVNGKISRFGWKADQPTLLDQIGAALRNDLAVKNELYSKLDCSNGCKEGKGLLPKKHMEEIETYISLLGVPPRTDPTNPRVMAGEAIFRRLGCDLCHIPNVKTGNSRFKELSGMSIQPFTDLLLHDMGEGLKDDSGKPNASKWRTAPLWSLKNVRAANENHMDKFASGNINILWPDTHREAAKNKMQFLHDGRADSIMEAILWHGGEAEAMKRGYMKLSKEERETLEAFLWDI